MGLFSFSSIEVDGQQTIINAADNNLVEVAQHLKINIPAPCLKNRRRDGCCKACLVEIDGKRDYACSTKPKSGMKVTVRTKELDNIRKTSIKQYKQNIKDGNTDACDCSC
ncbi:2Fe-2S iron-sulfur cluster-binding protein [Vibrio maerlii]|uniref:2Fe-2S iron-sulfur cluster-binding protein n=1 Tax=Vibrio maerlii TaxID=2231648 RepID=UPI000E3E11F2|nr:2Fe-2S iron-sulfur cluster-binding protein [Vibrio maerlii]